MEYDIDITSSILIKHLEDISQEEASYLYEFRESFDERILMYLQPLFDKFNLS